MNLKKLAVAGVRVVTTNARLAAGKVVHGGGLRYSPMTCLALNDRVALSKDARLSFGPMFRTRGDCVFNVQESGVLLFGKDIFLNKGCMFNCRNEITVGEGCEFGPNVLVYDHDHDFRSVGGIKDRQFVYDSVRIGNNCWIGAGSVILRGTTLGDGCVVGAGSVLKGDYPASSLIVQRRRADVIPIFPDDMEGEQLD